MGLAVSSSSPGIHYRFLGSRPQLEQQLQQQSQQQQSQQQRQSQQQKQQDVKEQLPLCVPPATAPAKLEAVIEQCQDEIKQAVLEEALQVLGDASRELELASNTRSKRETFTSEERRIAGCLLQCVYRKVKAVDENGLPTVSGLVHLYSDGVSDRNYFLATLQAVHQCMTLANNRRAFNTQVEEGFYAFLAGSSLCYLHSIDLIDNCDGSS
ncbi:odorant binding [Homalodisca vitripennis]|nr:odorant binding [Homalodisca vitripennis]